MAIRHRLLSSTALAAILVWCGPEAVRAAEPYTPDFSAAGPAVSAVNGKIGVFGGSISGDEAYGVVGSLSLPLGSAFGLQFDGMAGSAGGAGFYGVAAHLFWRDPSKGLIGAYASYVDWDAASQVPAPPPADGFTPMVGAEVAKAGLAMQAYLGRVSLEGLAAYQWGTDTGFAGNATLAYYPVDDLRLALSVSHLVGLGTSGSVGAEWAPAAAGGLSLFADGTIADGGDWRAFGGVRFYLAGESKSLIRRHREDDPEVELPKNLYQTTGACPPGTFDDGAYCEEE